MNHKHIEHNMTEWKLFLPIEMPCHEFILDGPLTIILFNHYTLHYLKYVILYHIISRILVWKYECYLRSSCLWFPLWFQSHYDRNLFSYSYFTLQSKTMLHRRCTYTGLKQYHYQILEFTWCHTLIWYPL